MRNENTPSLPKYLCKVEGTEEIRFGTAILALTSDNLVLLELRSDVHQWGLFGGKLDAGETPEQCASREFYEETGCLYDPSKFRLFHVYGDPTDGRIIQYPERRVQLIDAVYILDIQSSIKVTLSPESVAAELFPLSKLPSNLVPPSRRILFDAAKVRA